MELLGCVSQSPPHHLLRSVLGRGLRDRNTNYSRVYVYSPPILNSCLAVCQAFFCSACEGAGIAQYLCRRFSTARRKKYNKALTSPVVYVYQDDRSHTAREAQGAPRIHLSSSIQPEAECRFPALRAFAFGDDARAVDFLRIRLVASTYSLPFGAGDSRPTSLVKA
jgi:hypothetical protein